MTEQQLAAFDVWFTSLGHVPGVKEAFDAGWRSRSAAVPSAEPGIGLPQEHRCAKHGKYVGAVCPDCAVEPSAERKCFACGTPLPPMPEDVKNRLDAVMDALSEHTEG